MKNKWFIALAALTLVLFSLCGCGEKSLLSDKDPVTLNMWHVYGEQTGSPMDLLIEEFNQTVGRENGVSIKVTGMSNASDIGNFLLDAQTGGSDVQDMPDLFTCHLDNASELGSENLVDWNEWFTKDELSQFIPGFLEDGQDGDSLIVFPVSKSTHVLMINGSAFSRFSEATGITYDDLSTWEGFYNAASEYYKWSGGKPFCALDYPVRAIELNALEHESGDFYTEDGWYDTDNAVLKDSFDQFSTSLVQGHVVMSDLYSNTQVMTGDVVCGIGSSAAILYYNDTVTYRDNTSEPMDLHVLPMPETEGSEPLMTQAGVGLCAYKTTDQKAEAASLFVHWLTEAERNLDFVTETGYMPVHKDSLKEIDNYDFADEKYKRLYGALGTMLEEYTPVSEPDFPGYYTDVKVFYDKLREIQKGLPARIAAGESISSLNEEIWNYFCSAADAEN